MPTSGERKALWFFATVALSGSAVRLWRSDPPIHSPALDRQLVRVDSARAAQAARRPRDRGPASNSRARPADPGPAAPVDIDRATAAEIERLPGIGPTLARRIVANRDSAGTFGAMDALCDVRGVGPALAEKLRPLATFTGPRRAVSVSCGELSTSSRKPRGVRHRKSR